MQLHFSCGLIIVEEAVLFLYVLAAEPDVSVFAAFETSDRGLAMLDLVDEACTTLPPTDISGECEEARRVENSAADTPTSKGLH